VQIFPTLRNSLCSLANSDMHRRTKKSQLDCVKSSPIQATSFLSPKAKVPKSSAMSRLPLRTIASNPRVEIGGLVVDESCRSQGVGRLLMARVEEWARSNGFTEARLRSNVIRESAHLFYENLGYRVNKTQKSFLKTL
jgi:ribosomal protein S18 acetylase RimI-like enzyme